MASEMVDPIDWSHPLPSWAIPPELLVHSIKGAVSVQPGIDLATSACEATTLPMRQFRVSYATATQGIMVEHRSCDAAGPGSCPQRGYETQLLLEKLPIVGISHRICSLCVQLSQVTVPD